MAAGVREAVPIGAKVEDREAQAADPGAAVWGPWSTAGLGLVVAGTFMAVQVAVAVVAALTATLVDPTKDLAEVAGGLAGDGLVLAVAIWASAAVGGGLVITLVILRRGVTPAAYLGLVPVRWRSLLGTLVATVVLAATYDGLCVLLDRPVVPPFMEEAYRTCRWPPLLWSAVVLAAPAFEEVFFRGFLLEGWRRSRLGGLGAALLTAALWAGIHLQYGVFEIGAIFLLGLVLAGFRLRTGSLLPCLAGHALVNLVATVETALQL